MNNLIIFIHQPDFSGKSQNGNFEFTLYNNGSIDEIFMYNFASTFGDGPDNWWYDYTDGSVLINSGESAVITIPGNIELGDEGDLDYNQVALNISSTTIII